MIYHIEGNIFLMTRIIRVASEENINYRPRSVIFNFSTVKKILLSLQYIFIQSTEKQTLCLQCLNTCLFSIDVLVNNTNLTILTLFYKISIEVSAKNNIASSGN